MLSHVINDLLYCNVHIVFYNTLIYASDYTLYDSELLKQLSSGI